MQLKTILILSALWVATAVAARGQTTPTRCEDEVLAQEKARRTAAFRQMYQPGATIANATIGSTSVYSLHARTVLLVFWKTDCPYCKNLLSVADSLLQATTPKQLQVVAVCLDTDKAAWQQHPFVQKKYRHLMHYCDGKGYTGSIATLYNIYATPTMLVLNARHRLVQLPKNVAALRQMVIGNTAL